MKKTLAALFLGLSAFAAQAQTESATAAADPAQDENIVITSENVETAAGNEAGCIRTSGTHLKQRDAKGCTGAPGQSYSREQIDRTGANNTADALKALSPRVTVRRGG